MNESRLSPQNRPLIHLKPLSISLAKMDYFSTLSGSHNRNFRPLEEFKETMISHTTSSSIFALIGLIVALATVPSMVFLSASLIAAESDNCEDKCENQCDDSCDDCGDCPDCLALQHMIPLAPPLHDHMQDDALWTVAAPSPQAEIAFPFGIDHPPQNA